MAGKEIHTKITLEGAKEYTEEVKKIKESMEELTQTVEQLNKSLKEFAELCEKSQLSREKTEAYIDEIIKFQSVHRGSI